MSEQVAQTQNELICKFDADHTQSVADDLSRPPTMSDSELAEVLERGRLVSRLKATQKLSARVLAYVDDTLTRDLISSEYLAKVLDNVKTQESELMQFNLQPATKTTSVKEVADSKVSAPKIYQVEGDFLKRRASAACAQTDPEVFFPEKGGSTKQAKRVCREACGMRDECLSFALENGERFGVWGGLSERERRALSRRAKAALR